MGSRSLPQDVTLTHPGIPDELRGEAIWRVKNLHLGGWRFVSFEDSDLHIIEGVWDVLMTGAAEIDIENRYQELTGGPAVTAFSSTGVIVFRPEGKTYQIQERFDEMEYTNAWGDQLKKLKRYIADNEIEPSEAGKILHHHNEERKQFLKKVKSLPGSKHYYEANRLPVDSRLVIRTYELEKFVQREKEQLAQKKSETKEDTLLIMIAGLLSHAGIKPEERGAAGGIVRMVERIGVSISDETVRGVLKNISGTVEIRMK